ncbi:MAG: AAA family ATPase [Saprospiraceae bacterium]
MLGTPIVLNQEFQDILHQLEHTSDSFFITGRAGTGKSTLLDIFRKSTKKKVIVLAPTGVAALHVQGQTIHSFFLFPPRFIGSKDIKKMKNHKLVNQLDTLIIDEISMVRADLLDAMDQALKLNRKSAEPFGGLQVIFFGDLFQLPPVVAQQEEKNYLNFHYQSHYFFSAHVIKQGLKLQYIELTKVFRQTEKQFIRLLESIRNASMDESDLEELNTRCKPGFTSSEYITLSARNATADQINTREMGKLPGKASIFSAEVTGDIRPSQYPTDLHLPLKVGARIIFLRNDTELKYVNGTLGTIEAIGDDLIKVVVKENGHERRIEVKKSNWDMIRYKAASPGKPIESEVIGSFAQFPLKLAWAITIHKSQGKSFDQVIIDLGSGAFEHGQAYVALSRCRSFNGLVLNRPLNMRDLIVDDQVLDFYQLVNL